LRYGKYVITATVIIAAMLLAAHLYRDNVARGLANSYLSNQGVHVSAVSIDAMHTDYVHFSRILVELDDGTIIHVLDVSLPYDTAAESVSSIEIGSVEITPGEGRAEVAAPASLLARVADAPEAIPASSIGIGRLKYADTLLVEDIRWSSEGPTQSIQLRLSGLVMDASLVSDETTRTLLLQARDSHGADALSCELIARHTPHSDDLMGPCDVSMEAWLPALHEFGVVPTDLRRLEATFRGPVRINLADDVPDSIRFTAEPELKEELHVSYGTNPQDAVHATAGTLGMSRIHLLYPSLEWQAELSSGDIVFSLRELEDVPVAVNNLKCRSGFHCALTAELNAVDFESDTWAANDVTVHILSLEINDSGEAISADVEIPAESATWTIGTQVLAPLGLNGSIQYDADQVVAKLDVLSGNGVVLAALDVQSDPALGAGSLSMPNAEYEFEDGSLSQFLRDWPLSWDVVAGAVTLSASVSWSTEKEVRTYEGSVDVAASGLNGKSGELAFAGLSTNVEILLDERQGIRVLPATISVDLLDIGVPIEDISVVVDPDMDAQLLHVNAVSMSALGGTLTADPFIYSLEGQAGDVMLRPESVQLQFMVELAEFESIDITGTISGSVPIRIAGDKVTVEGGRLESDEPGGVIQYYSPAGDEAMAEESQLGIVARALSNFHFESLDSDVDYSDTGDLLLHMTLKGVNPDMDPTQPVILNMNIENNVPQLLRSLQATRSIEDVLNQRAMQ